MRKIIVTVIILTLAGLTVTSTMTTPETESLREKTVAEYKEFAGAKRDIEDENRKRILINDRNRVAIDVTDYTSFRMSLDAINKEVSYIYGDKWLETFQKALIYHISTSGGVEKLSGVKVPPDIIHEDLIVEYYRPLHGLNAKEIFKIYHSRSKEEKAIFE